MCKETVIFNSIQYFVFIKINLLRLKHHQNSQFFLKYIENIKKMQSRQQQQNKEIIYKMNKYIK